jgi:NADH dehydrogenase (ubiquinone) 1 alpha subcomplex subunit 12
MVWGLIQNFRQAYKYRGGWKGLFENMYTVSIGRNGLWEGEHRRDLRCDRCFLIHICDIFLFHDSFVFTPLQNGDFPFKFGTYMGCDAAGNRYYENRVDYPYGQHRWVEPGDIHNFDSSSIPPEWHGWMVSMTDDTPSQTQEFIEEKLQYIESAESDANITNIVGHKEEVFNFHHLHNQSQVRSRGYGIGNPIVGLPPFAKDSYYTQPGSPYNPASMRKTEMIGELPNNRPYKSEKWRKRLMTEEEKAEERRFYEEVNRRDMEALKKQSTKELYTARGAGTVLRKRTA